MNYENIYFDIAPRRSGKTTRLIEEVMSYLMSNANNTVDIVCYTSNMSHYLYNIIMERFPNLSNRIELYRDCNSSCELHEIHRYHIQHENNMVFFDESDLIRYKFLYDRCYYSTTNTNGSTLRYRNEVFNINEPQEFLFYDVNRRRHINRLSRDLSNDIDNIIINNITELARNDIDIDFYNRYNTHDIFTRRVFDDNNMTLNESDEENYPDLDDSTDEEYFLHRIGAK